MFCRCKGGVYVEDTIELRKPCLDNAGYDDSKIMHFSISRDVRPCVFVCATLISS